MSWNAYLIDDRGHIEGDWNYTHNCNGMIARALEKTPASMPGESWWQTLNGKPGPDGVALLDGVLREFAADPDRYRAMNPENGWGDYDSLLGVLTEMRDAVPEWPTVWKVNG